MPNFVGMQLSDILKILLSVRALFKKYDKYFENAQRFVENYFQYQFILILAVEGYMSTNNSQLLNIR